MAITSASDAGACIECHGITASGAGHRFAWPACKYAAQTTKSDRLRHGSLAGRMLEKLLTEQSNPASEGIDALPTGQILRIINEEDGKVADAVSREIPAITRAVDTVVSALQQGGRLFYIGAGTSGRLGVLDAAECPPTFNVAPEIVQGIMAGGEKALARETQHKPPAPAPTVAVARSLPSPMM